MSSKITAVIYHNPRCSKSRGSLEILQEQGVEVEEVFYLETPPTKAKLSEICDLMSVKPFEIVRTGETLFNTLGLSKTDQKTDDEWLDILIENPLLIERPIIQIGHRAVIGRPPEAVLGLLS